MGETLPQAEVEKKLVAAACLLGFERSREILQNPRLAVSILEERAPKKKSSGVIHARYEATTKAGKSVKSACGVVKGADGNYASKGERVTCGRCLRVQKSESQLLDSVHGHALSGIQR